MNQNTTESITIITTTHRGRGSHRAGSKIKTNDQLATKTENRRRQRTAKATKLGRRRAETHKVNLTWFIGFIAFAAIAFMGIYGFLIGLMFPEPTVAVVTHEYTISKTYSSPVIPNQCLNALDTAENGFQIAESKPKVKTQHLSPKKTISHVVAPTVPFYKNLQVKVYAQDNKFIAQKTACLNTDTTSKLVSQSVEENTNK